MCLSLIGFTFDHQLTTRCLLKWTHWPGRWLEIKLLHLLVFAKNSGFLFFKGVGWKWKVVFTRGKFFQIRWWMLCYLRVITLVSRIDVSSSVCLVSPPRYRTLCPSGWNLCQEETPPLPSWTRTTRDDPARSRSRLETSVWRTPTATTSLTSLSVLRWGCSSPCPTFPFLWTPQASYLWKLYGCRGRGREREREREREVSSVANVALSALRFICSLFIHNFGGRVYTSILGWPFSAQVKKGLLTLLLS